MRHPANMRRDAVLLTPFDVLAAEEDREKLDAQLAAEEALAIMAEVALDWLGWIFEGGPDLFRVGERFHSLATEYVPHLQPAMTEAARAACFYTMGLPQAQAAKAAVARSNPHLVNRAPLTPFDVMLSRERARCTEEEYLRREQGLIRWLRWLYSAGGGLLVAVKRLYSQVRACRPELLRCMSGEQIAVLFNQVRATESARTIKVTEETLLAGGCRFTALPYQKSASAVEAYAQAQLGNRNRVGGRRAA